MLNKSACFRVILASIALASCASDSLTREEKEKLDPALQRLLASEEREKTGLDVSARSDGEREYGVIIRSNAPEEIRSTGVRIQSVFGEIVTARLTVREVASVARLRSVVSIAAGSRNYPQ